MDTTPTRPFTAANLAELPPGTVLIDPQDGRPSLVLETRVRTCPLFDTPLSVEVDLTNLDSGDGNATWTAHFRPDEAVELAHTDCHCYDTPGAADPFCPLHAGALVGA